MKIIISNKIIRATSSDADLGALVRQQLAEAVCKIDDRDPGKCTDLYCACTNEI